MSDRPKPTLTLVGMPVFTPIPPPLPPESQEPDPFPLVPYRDAGVSYTVPERTIQREIRRPDRHAVMLPPTSPAARQLAQTVVLKRATSPSSTALVVAAGLVCWSLAIGVLLSL